MSDENLLHLSGEAYGIHILHHDDDIEEMIYDDWRFVLPYSGKRWNI